MFWQGLTIANFLFQEGPQEPPKDIFPDCWCPLARLGGLWSLGHHQKPSSPLFYRVVHSIFNDLGVPGGVGQIRVPGQGIFVTKSVDLVLEGCKFWVVGFQHPIRLVTFSDDVLAVNA